MAIIFTEGFEDSDDEAFREWWAHEKGKHEPLPPNCFMRQTGDFEVEILKCPSGYVIVEKGKYEWVQVEDRWELREREG